MRRRWREVPRQRQLARHRHRAGEAGRAGGASRKKTWRKTEKQKAEADLKNIDNELSVAENDYKAAKLQLDTAKLQQKTAETSGDVNRKNQSMHDVRVAELGVKAADVKVDWLNEEAQVDQGAARRRR